MAVSEVTRWEASEGTWFLRPVLWFATASMVTTILHELTHATVAYALGVRSTLFSYFVDLDLTPTQAANRQGAAIGVAGPLVCLLLGVLAWLALRRVRDPEAGLPLVYFSVFGFGTFFGNVMSVAFVGDFSSVALALGLPRGVLYALADEDDRWHAKAVAWLDAESELLAVPVTVLPEVCYLLATRLSFEA